MTSTSEPFVDWLVDTRPITYTPPPACRPGSIHRLAHQPTALLEKAAAFDMLLEAQQRGAKPRALAVLLYVLGANQRAAGAPTAPARAAIAEGTHLCLRTVDAAKNDLSDLGYLDWDLRYDDGAYEPGQPARHYRRQDTNGYVLPPPGMRHLSFIRRYKKCPPSPPSAKQKFSERKKQNCSGKGAGDNSYQIPENPPVSPPPARDWRAIAELRNRQIIGQDRRALKKGRETAARFARGAAERDEWDEPAAADAERLARAAEAAEVEAPPWRARDDLEEDDPRERGDGYDDCELPF